MEALIIPKQEFVGQLFPKLLVLYWTLAAGSVVVTILPIPVPQAFKYVY